MSKMKVHAVVGRGTAPAKVINEGLRDVVGKEDTVSLVWLGKPKEGEEAVYDFVLEHDVSFQMFYNDDSTPPRVFREADHGAVQKVRNPLKSALESVENGGKVLYLWDADADDDQVEVVFDIIDAGTLVLELTNGLAPISIDMDIPEPEEPVLEKDPEEEAVSEDTLFTKDELAIMTPFAVKRYGERQGCKATTKGGIIKELFPEGQDGDEGGDEVEQAVAAAAPSPATDDGLELSEVVANFNAAIGNITRNLEALGSASTLLAEKVYSD